MEISCFRLSKTFQIRRSVISIIITRRSNVWRGSQRHRTLVVSIRGIPKIRSSFREIEQPTSHFASRHGLKFNSSNDWLIPLPAIRIFYDVGRREDHPPREIGDPLDPRKSQRVIILISSPFISINPSCPLDESIHQQPNSRGNGSSGLPMNIPLNEDRRVPMAPFEAHTYSSGVLAASSTESRPVFLWWKCLSHVASLSLSLSLSLSPLAPSRVFHLNTGMASSRKLERKINASFLSAVREFWVSSRRPVFGKFERDDSLASPTFNRADRGNP